MLGKDYLVELLSLSSINEKDKKKSLARSVSRPWAMLQHILGTMLLYVGIFPFSTTAGHSGEFGMSKAGFLLCKFLDGLEGKSFLPLPFRIL